MKKIILIIILFITNYHVFSQDLLLPIKNDYFALNHHTNRDISYFSHIDTNNNTVIVGTTEKDSTFTDIITTKLNENLELVWQKHLSIDTSLSYDIPVKSFINSNNELYIIGRSAFNQSNSNGLIFVIKYGENGNIIYNKTIGDIDGSDYVDYGYMNAELNDDDTLNMVYSPVNYNTYDSTLFKFLKIDNSGNTIDSFEKEIPNRGVTGLINDGIYYLFTKKLIDEVNYLYNYEFYRITNSTDQSLLEISDSEFVTYFNGAILSDNVHMTIDGNKNIFLACPNEFGGVFDSFYTHTLQIAKIDAASGLKYIVSTSESDDYFLIDSFINEENEHIVVANNLNNNTIDFISVDENNLLQLTPNPNNFLGTGFKKNPDNTFFITTSNSNIRLFSNELVELNSFNTSNSYELVDFVKIDDQSISTIGTSYEKMFPESDYFTQLDIHSEKLNDTQILNNYSFSGIGTSRAFQQRVIIDNDNNYLVLVTEKMGPEYLGIGGANPPLNKRIIKYDSNLNKIWESEVPEYIFNLVNHGGRDIDFFIDASNDLYLNLPRAGDNYGLGYDLYKVNPNGDFEFINATYVADKFYANENSIFMAENYFLYEDSSILHVLDKDNGNLIEEIDVGHEEFLDIFSIGNDYYFYTYEEITNNTPDFLYLYKNGVKLFTRNLSNNYGIYQYEIDDEGTLLFATDYAGDRRLNKIDINNSYSYYNTSDDITRFKTFNNGNIFLYLDDNSTLILDNNLSFIVNGEDINSWNPYLMTWDNYILFGTSFENSIRVINQNGDIIGHFITNGFLHDWYSQFDDQGNLIMVGQLGNKISTYNEYSWSRGLINNYGTLNNILNVEDIEDNNTKNELIIYPNPTSDILNIKLRNEQIEKVILYDMSGKQLKEFKKSTINLKEFKAGLYLIKIFTTSKNIINSKIIKD
ncbi:MAG: hypothetical protein ACI9EK_002645 [Psychroserpens sp.]|jgi:hypothetical protein